MYDLKTHDANLKQINEYTKSLIELEQREEQLDQQLSFTKERHETLTFELARLRYRSKKNYCTYVKQTIGLSEIYEFREECYFGKCYHGDYGSCHCISSKERITYCAFKSMFSLPLFEGRGGERPMIYPIDELPLEVSIEDLFRVDINNIRKIEEHEVPAMLKHEMVPEEFKVFLRNRGKK